DVDTLGDDELQDRLAEQVLRDAHRDRAETGDLADLVALDVAALHRLEIGADQPEIPARRPLRLAGPLSRHALDEGVERVRLPRLPILRCALRLEVLVDDRFDRRPEREAGL